MQLFQLTFNSQSPNYLSLSNLLLNELLDMELDVLELEKGAATVSVWRAVEIRVLIERLTSVGVGTTSEAVELAEICTGSDLMMETRPESDELTVVSRLDVAFSDA